MNGKRMLSMIVQTIILYISAYPVIYLVGEVWLDGQLDTFLLMLAFGSLFGYVLGAVQIKIYVEHTLVFLASIISAYFLFGLKLALPAAIVVLGLMINRCAWITRGEWEEAFPINLQIAGVISYMMLPLLGRLVPGLEVNTGVHFALGFTAVATLFYRVNEIQLAKANLAQDTHEVPPVVKFRNRIMLGALLLVILLIVQMEAVRAWLARMWGSFIHWLNEVLPKGAEPDQAPGLPPDFGGGLMEPLAPEKEISPFWQSVQEFVLNTISVLLAVGFVAIFIFLLVKKLIPWLGELIARMNHAREPVQDYEDLTEKLDRPNLQQALRSAFGRLLIKREAMPEDDRGKVRLLYRWMLQAAAKDGYAHNSSYTPNETEAELRRIGWHKQSTAWLTGLYNQVRYGEKAISSEDKRRLEEELKR